MQGQNISDIIERYLKEILADSEEVEIRRSEIADQFDVVPSQINYVIKTRFTIQNGYLVESKRGGGGYIRIEKVKLLDDIDVLDSLIRVIGDSINERDAISILSSENIRVTATAIYGTMSAFLAAKAGAEFLAPYVNRLDNLGYNGVQTALDIHMMVKAAGYKAEVLGASFKNAQQVIDMGKGGIGAVTVSSDLLKSLAFNGIAENAVKDFIRDFESCCGEGKTMLDF